MSMPTVHARDVYGADPSASVPVEPLLLTPEQAARRLSIGRTRVYELMTSGELPSVKIGASRRIAVEALHRFIAAHSVGGDAA